MNSMQAYISSTTNNWFWDKGINMGVENCVDSLSDDIKNLKILKKRNIDFVPINDVVKMVIKLRKIKNV